MIKRKIRQFKAWMNYNPPRSLSATGWRLFNEEYKEEAPVRYWVSKTFRYKIQLPVKWKIESISSYIRYRTYDKYHVLNTGLAPDYYAIDQQMLHVNFQLLKDFVEVETAWQAHYMSGEHRNEKKWWQSLIPRLIRKNRFRRPELGVKHFEWASTLDDPALPAHERCDHQAIAAREILELYHWWVDQRPSRKEIDLPPYSHQGLGSLASLDDRFDQTATDYVLHKQAYDQSSNQEEFWDKEDEGMLIRLIKIRKHLWT